MTPSKPTDNKKRVIVDYKNVTQDILTLFADRYPYGYDSEDIVKFTKPNGDTVRAVPFETLDAKYLIKIGAEMDQKIDAFLEDADSGSNLPDENIEVNENLDD